VISRNDKVLVWQYINWRNVIKYIDNLKSRIYKAFLYKYLPEIYKQQSVFIVSQLVIMLAVKKSILNTNLVFNTFELGYCLFCLSNSKFLDLSFYCYYSEDYSSIRISEVKYFIRKIKHYIIIWSLEPYYNYLLYLNNLYDIQSYNLNNFKNRTNDKLIHKYYLYFDLSLSIHSVYLSFIVDKLYLDETIKKNLFEFLDFLSSSMLLDKNCSSIASKLLDLFQLQFCYEIHIMFGRFYFYKYRMNEILFINDGFGFVVLSKDNKEIKRLRSKILNFLLFQGIFVIKKPEVETICFSKGINLDLLYVSTNYAAYPFYLIIKPSLYSQFLLMKYLSAILIQSISKPLFLLVIRLNRLLFLWSINNTTQKIQRIIYLIDYLITLKLRLFIKKKRCNLHICNKSILIKYGLFMKYDYSNIYLLNF